MERVLDFVTGKLSRRMMLSALIPLIFIFYFGTLVITVFLFPRPYDWRSGVISNLLSPAHNPEFHWFASLGLSLAGLCAVPFGGYIGHRFRPVTRLWANIGATALTGGFVTFILAVVIVTRRSHPIFGMLGVHEMLARTAAVGLGIGIICFNGCALQAARSIVRDRYGRGLLFSWSCIALLAVVSIAGSLCTVLLPKFGVFGLSPGYRLLRLSPLWHLAFWEWIGSAAVFFFLVSAAWLLPRNSYCHSWEARGVAWCLSSVRRGDLPVGKKKPAPGFSNSSFGHTMGFKSPRWIKDKTWPHETRRNLL